jgi:1,2-diacylglycerol 3-beta-galactosyltransferase
MPDKKRILILTADAGFGHRSAAKAIAAALEESHGGECSYEIVNALDHEKTPFWLREVQSDYDRIAREAAKLYKFSYDISDTQAVSKMMESAMRVLLYRTMRDIVLSFQPDAIVSTYPLYQAPLEALYTLRRCSVPTVCVITDLVTVHQAWFTGASDLFVVPTETVRSIALGAGVPAGCVEVIGIPVHPSIAGEKRSKAELRAKLGWREDLATVLAVGSKRVGGLAPALDALNHSALPLQLAVVAGGDDALYASMRSREWHLPAAIYNFVDNMPELMRASDFVVAKPGGLIVTESMAAGLPMLFVDMIPGQETGNAEYVVSGGAGAVAEGGLEVLEQSYHLLADGGSLLKERAAAAKALGRPRAAFDIVDRAWAFAQRGPGACPDIAAAAIAKLKDLFSRFDESPED